MKITKIVFLGLIMVCAACAKNKNVDIAESETPKIELTTEFTIDYEKFTLENGLEVVLHVDNSDPIVALTTVVHAGSNREKPGRTGFAHFFEHMSFNDSENVPRGWNRKAIPEWGGSRNGGTWSDGTIYYEQVPKDAFDKILWIDSDRLGYMINTVTTEALEREKQVVKNEKRQRVDNAPYGYTQEIIRKNLYPQGHPYSWTVIGALPDLQAATLDDVKEFYEEFYGPNNATLAIAGDIDIAETKKKVELWFGEIKKGNEIKALDPMPVTLEKTKSLFFEDNFAKLPELRITYPSIEGYHADEQALDILGSLLSGSKNAPLYKVIVEEQKLAPEVSTYNRSSEIAGEFVFRVRANAGTDLDAVKKAIDVALLKFESDGVSERDLERIKAEQETVLYSNFSTILNKSRQLASDNEFAGNPAYAVEQAKLLQAVTSADVMRVYKKFIKDKHAVITSVIPKGQKELAIQSSELATVWIEEVKENVASEEVSQGAEADYEKTVTRHDRSEPEFGALPLVKMPIIWDGKLNNGIPILGIENSEVPLVTFDVTFKGGSWLDPLDKKGASVLLASLMMQGTANKTSAELEEAIGLLGSGISIDSSAEELTFNVTCLSRNFESTVELLKEILFEPRWDVSEYERLMTATITSLKGREANPNSIAALAYYRLIYGDEHPLGTPDSGTLHSVSTISLDDLRAVYKNLSPANATVHVAGNIQKARVLTALNNMSDTWQADAVVLPDYPIPEQSNAGKVFFIDVPGSKQSVLYIGKLALSSLNEDANNLDFTNDKLGGGSSGALFQTLRIEKGYTYGAYSGVGSGIEIQPFIARGSMRANATNASLTIIRDMIENYANDFSDADIEITKQKLVKANTSAFESLGAKLGTLRQISKYEKAKNYVELDQAELVAMSLDDFRDIANKYLQESEMTYVVVGDKATQLEPVKEFADGEVIELDIYGNFL